VHNRLPKDDGSLAADEIAAMVGLSVGEVSDLLGTDAGSAPGVPDAVFARVTLALSAVHQQCTHSDVPRAEGQGTAAARSPRRHPANLDAQLATLLASVTAELSCAENVLDISADALAVIADEAALVPDAAHFVRAALQRGVGVRTAAQDAERRTGGD
jgi:hypothetical protein